MTTRRILLGGLWHETNTFSPIKTDLGAFQRFGLAEGEDIIKRFAGSNTEIGGVVGVAADLGLDLAPSLYAGAVPSGPIRRELLNYFVERICAPLRDDGDIAGALLVLHGAMVAEGVDDADAFVARAVRAALPPNAPLVIVLDSHGNLTQGFVETADLIIGYDTLPHVDMADRGAEAARLMAMMLETGKRPRKAFRKLPLLTSPQMQATGEPPMRSVSTLRGSIEQRAGIVTCSVMLGFPYADTPTLGMAVVAYAEEQGMADAAADALADALWSSREAFTPSMLAVDAAVREALANPGRPVILIEPSDNVGGGAPGDNAYLLQALVDRGAEGAVVTLWDPEAADAAKATGVGNRWRGAVGAKSLPHGAPLQVDGLVRFANRVIYRRDRKYMTGQLIDLGCVAVLDVAGVLIVLTTERAMPFDSQHLRAVGIDPAQAKIISMKCGSNWSVAFGDIAAAHFYIDTPGVTSSDVSTLPYTRLDSRYFPLDRNVSWPVEPRGGR